MEVYNTLPIEDGFRMPAEYEPHQGCVMVWPVRPGSWPYGGVEAQHTFTQLARAIAESEQVWMLADKEHREQVKAVFLQDKNIQVLEIPTDDAWARDIGPTCVVNDAGQVRGIDWQFNAWGGTYDGLYADWKKDNRAASLICEQLHMNYYNAQHFVLEGGAIHSDGEGTVLVTEACLLSQGRNPQLSKVQIEQQLKQYLGAKKIIWLPHGIYQDETNEHIDNMCAFVGAAKVVLAWTDNQEDPQWKWSNEAMQVLQQEKDAKGRELQVIKLPIPDSPICITKEEQQGFSFEEGEDSREVGERLAASYVNFYIANAGVMVPQFGDAKDAIAVAILSALFPNRKIYPIPAQNIIVGGGNIHCITQQIPKGKCKV